MSLQRFKNNFAEMNAQRYNQIWESMDVQKPEIWSTWKVIKKILGKNNLEVGPGNYPNIPIKNGYFLDISKVAVYNLKKAGAKAFLGNTEKINFPKNNFDLVVALDILEHVDDDKKAILEISRVLKKGKFFLFSVPLRKENFSEIDKIAGHKRRYEISELIDLLTKAGFKIIKWRRPSLKYWSVFDKLPFCKKFVKMIYVNKKSYNFFGLPKIYVNFLTRFTAFIDRISAPNWENSMEKLKGFNGSSILVLCRKD